MPQVFSRFLASAGALLLGLALAGSCFAQSSLKIGYNKDGVLVLPGNYAEWVFIGTGFATSYAENANPAAELFHNVYVNPEAYREYKKTGTWPDKTVLVLELRNSAANVSINTKGRVSTEIASIEAHVKDLSHKTDFSKDGWAFYGFNAQRQNGKYFPKDASCFTCHGDHGAVDTTFVQFYPSLIETAKQHGTFRDSAAARSTKKE